MRVRRVAMSDGLSIVRAPLYMPQYPPAGIAHSRRAELKATTVCGFFPSCEGWKEGIEIVRRDSVFC
jgi:hypothetical protein